MTNQITSRNNHRNNHKRLHLSPVWWARFFWLKLLRLRDDPQAIALGLAWGIFIGWTPTVGIQMPLVLIPTILTRSSKLAGIIGVQFSNWLTVPAVYYLDYLVGSWVLGARCRFRIKGFDFWDMIHQASGLFWVMMVGGLIIGLVTGVATYFITLRLLQLYRRRGGREALGAGTEPGECPANPGQAQPEGQEGPGPKLPG